MIMGRGAMFGAGAKTGVFGLRGKTKEEDTTVAASKQSRFPVVVFKNKKHIGEFLYRRSGLVRSVLLNNSYFVQLMTAFRISPDDLECALRQFFMIYKSKDNQQV